MAVRAAVAAVPCSLFTRCLDILLLAAMAFLPTATAPARHLLVAVHLLRMAVANATRPLMRSGASLWPGWAVLASASLLVAADQPHETEALPCPSRHHLQF